MYLTTWCFTIEDRASRAMMLVLVLYYKVFVITLNVKSTEILGCIVLGMRLNFVTFCHLKTYGLRLQNAEHAVVFISGIHVGIFKGVVFYIYIMFAWVYR